MLPDAEIYWHLPRAKSLSHFCVCHPLRGHGNLARRIKLTRVTKENLQLKILEAKGAARVGDPCYSIGGASPGLAPNKPVAKAIMLISWQHHMDSAAERSKAVAQGTIP